MKQVYSPVVYAIPLIDPEPFVNFPQTLSEALGIEAVQVALTFIGKGLLNDSA